MPLINEAYSAPPPIGIDPLTKPQLMIIYGNTDGATESWSRLRNEGITHSVHDVEFVDSYKAGWCLDVASRKPQVDPPDGIGLHPSDFLGRF